MNSSTSCWTGRILRVRDWDQNFGINRTRKLKTAKWAAMNSVIGWRNRPEGRGTDERSQRPYRFLTTHTEATAGVATQEPTTVIHFCNARKEAYA